jgi:F-type H+-transporting ATPase subunit alpha
VAGTLRLDLAQYRELEAFAQFASDLDAATKQQLIRGERLVEILKQGQYSPLTVEMQAVHIIAGQAGSCDDLTPPQVVPYIEALTTKFETSHKDLLAEVLERGSFKKSDLKDRIIAAIKAFRATYQPV